MKNGYKLSIVIPTYNRPDQLGYCLQSLSTLNLPAHGTEVIVVNDGENRRNLEVSKRYAACFDLRLSNQSHSGPSVARNLGAKLAKGHHLAFLDDDCGVGADWIFQATAALEKHPTAMLGGTTLNGLPANPYATASQMLIDYLYAYQEESPGLRFFTSNNVIMPTAHFLRMGGFNVQFRQPGGEDRDLCYRWQQGGGQLVHVPALTVIHYRQMNLVGFWRQHYSYGNGALRIHSSQAGSPEKRIPRLEPLTFYLRMLSYVGKQQPQRNRLYLLRALITLSQVAYAAGVGRALFQPV